MSGVCDTGRTHAPSVLAHWLAAIKSHVPSGEVNHIVDPGSVWLFLLIEL